MGRKGTHSDHGEDDADGVYSGLGWRHVQCIPRGVHGIDGHIQGEHTVSAFRLVIAGIHGYRVGPGFTNLWGGAKGNAAVNGFKRSARNLAWMGGTRCCALCCQNNTGI